MYLSPEPFRHGRVVFDEESTAFTRISFPRHTKAEGTPGLPAAMASASKTQPHGSMVSLINCSGKSRVEDGASLFKKNLVFLTLHRARGNGDPPQAESFHTDTTARVS